ncbi:MAG: hypothetical protein WED34_09650 [Planctomycetales bacterium]
MSSIIRRLPFSAERTEAMTPTGPVVVRPYQAIVWVSLSVQGKLSARFPAILDTGHSHNFSIHERHLAAWAGLNRDDLAELGVVLVNRQAVELRQADIALWRNVPGRRDELQEAAPFLLRAPDGIAVHEEGTPYAPRLPLLGMRALVRNRLRLTVDGADRSVSIRRPWSWFGRRS